MINVVSILGPEQGNWDRTAFAETSAFRKQESPKVNKLGPLMVPGKSGLIAGGFHAGFTKVDR